MFNLPSLKGQSGLPAGQAGFAAVLVLGLTAFLLAGGISGGTYYYASNEKKEIKSLTKKQSENFSNLQEKYKKIVDTYKNANDSSNTENSVLGIKYEKGQVLGIEDSPSIILSRQLLELFRDAKQNTKQIQDTNSEIKQKTQNPLVKPFLGTTLPLEKTDQFVSDTDAIITYLEKSTDIQIKASTVGYDVGISLGKAILDPSEDQIKSLEDKIDELRVLAEEAKEASGTATPQGLEDAHDLTVKNSEKLLGYFDKIPTLLRQKDAVALDTLFKNIAIDAGAESQTAEVIFMSFWQSNPTIRSVEDLQKEWSSASNKL